MPHKKIEENKGNQILGQTDTVALVEYETVMSLRAGGKIEGWLAVIELEGD